jgi:TfoX/Sxy family transcriptional regulator of competence genes
MTWEKTDAALAAALAECLAGFDARKQQMFGCPVWFAGDNMFTGVKGGTVFLRLSEDDRAAISEECDEIAPFEPRPGFFMKEYVSLPETVLSDAGFMQKWLLNSYAYTVSLPPKEKKSKKAK